MFGWLRKRNGEGQQQQIDAPSMPPALPASASMPVPTVIPAPPAPPAPVAAATQAPVSPPSVTYDHPSSPQVEAPTDPVDSAPLVEPITVAGDARANTAGEAPAPEEERREAPVETREDVPQPEVNDVPRPEERDVPQAEVVVAGETSSTQPDAVVPAPSARPAMPLSAHPNVIGFDFAPILTEPPRMLEPKAALTVEAQHELYRLFDDMFGPAGRYRLEWRTNRAIGDDAMFAEMMTLDLLRRVQNAVADAAELERPAPLRAITASGENVYKRAARDHEESGNTSEAA